MDHNARIVAAIRDLDSQERPNIATTTRKYNIVRTTLAYRFRGETGIIQDAISYVRK
jgi:hypothetical protein